jgi:hypothetical protein
MHLPCASVETAFEERVMNIKNFVATFAAYLEKQREPMVHDVSKLLAKPVFKFARGKSFDDVTALFFEYQYESFNMGCWPADRLGNPLANMFSLPANKKVGKKSRNSKWSSFSPERLSDDFEAFIEQHEEDEDTLREAYNQALTRAYVRWFIQCWKVAAKLNDGGPPVHVFFSIHDTYFRTNLRTNKECNGDEISKLVKKRPG